MAEAGPVPLRPHRELGTEWSAPPADLRLVEHSFENSRGKALYGKHLLQADRLASRGSVLCFFGAGDHSNSPYHGGQMVTLARMGFDVHSFDYESQGRSEGMPRFFHPDFQLLVDDAVQFTVHHVSAHARPDAQLFVFGESMGGAVGLLFTQSVDVSGAVLLAPMCKLGAGMKPGPIMTAVFSFLARITPRTFLPGFKPPPPYDPQAKDVEGYAALPMWEQQHLDPLRVQQHPPLLGTALALLNTTIRISSSMENFTAPMLLMGGLNDRVCSPAAVKELHTRSRSGDKTIKQFEGMGHTILAEDADGTVEAELRAWLLARCQASRATGWRETPLPAPPTGLPFATLHMLAVCAAFGGVAALFALGGIVHAWIVIAIVLLLWVVNARSLPTLRQALRRTLPAALMGIILVLYQADILDPKWFPHSGCPLGESYLDPTAGSDSTADCGIQEWRKGE